MTANVSGMAVRRQFSPRLRRIAHAARDTLLGYSRWLQAEAESAWQEGGAATTHHALVVATSLPPRFDGGVFRPLSWFCYASENGWRVSALTQALSGDETEAGRQLAATIPPEVRVCRAAPPALKPSWRLFMQVDGGFLVALELYRAGRDAFTEDPPSVVVATGPKFSAFIAGSLLARRFGTKLVLDYRDEWSENPFGFVQTGRNDRWWEKRCLRAADMALYTTESALRHAEHVFSGVMDKKGAVLPNGWEPAPSVEDAAGLPRADDRLIVATSGVLGTMASPAPFLRDMALAIEREPALRAALRLRFIGRRLDSAERELARFPYPELYDLIDQRPRPEADRLIRQSDVALLMTDDQMARYLPGKLFEYLASGRPILVHGRPGEARALVERLGAGVFVEQGHPDELARALGSLSRTSPDVWNTRRRREWAQQHTRRRMAHAFFERLSALVSGRDGEPPP